MQNSHALVQVRFHEDVIDCVQTESGVKVSIRRGCENLGVDTAGQIAKLKMKPWAVIEEISMTGPDGKNYGMACLDLDSVPMWLATIDTRKVKPHLREKLVRYQREAAKVLADHFFGRKEAPQTDTCGMNQIIAVLTSFMASQTQIMLTLVERLAVPQAAPQQPVTNLPVTQTERIERAMNEINANPGRYSDMGSRETGEKFGISGSMAAKLIRQATGRPKDEKKAAAAKKGNFERAAEAAMKRASESFPPSLN